MMFGQKRRRSSSGGGGGVSGTGQSGEFLDSGVEGGAFESDGQMILTTREAISVMKSVAAEIQMPPVPTLEAICLDYDRQSAAMCWDS